MSKIIQGFVRPQTGGGVVPSFVPNLRLPERWRVCLGCKHRFWSRPAACPVCGRSSDFQQTLALIHLLQPDANGPIRGQDGYWKIACDGRRDYLATHVKFGHGETNNEQGTDQLSAANCPMCLATLGLKYEDLHQGGE